MIVSWVLLAWTDDTYGRPAFWAKLLIVILLGFVWIVPFKKIYTGIGKGEECARLFGPFPAA
ncbi:DUF2842 domain-containing protein [Paracoccus sp. SCSIO 75233]|uniref:DUF2842 domain-containing protein n=1 Tax=Paracoccus sp. SCSIO 75233 TaxID=3017782 RepID=UPI0022F04A12|nr:DUF2842 domain-containing protein [Paracoccus sp. SCSIO 75233]WBU54422.1 DUF2842 domain-containing protein [Paracoccus sp. SCSIO 75233]